MPTEKVTFSAGPQQQSIMRDGRSSIVSKKKNSVVMVSPAARELSRGSRPVFVVALHNAGDAPRDFRVSDISVVERDEAGSGRSLQVVSYEQLVGEERARQVVGALLVGVAAAGNVAAAHNNSYYRGGRYSPIAGAINSAHADAQNAAMIQSAAATGQFNMAALEKDVLKDNTILPQEWIGGQLHIEAPSGSGTGPKQYVITVPVGEDLHEIAVTQGSAS